MTELITDTNKYLQLGVDAARKGRRTESREYFKLALKQTPEHIPSLLWLAFVAESPEESLHALEKVLAIDPENERAKAGVVWARRQSAEAAPNREENAPDDASDIDEPDADPPLNRDDFISPEDIQERARKGLMAHRARRNINPFLAVWLLLGAAAMIVAGIWALTIVPAETLAAWLPETAPDATGAAALPVPPGTASQQPAVAPAAGLFSESSPNTGEAAGQAEVIQHQAPRHFSQQGDTFIPPTSIPPVNIVSANKPATAEVEAVIEPEIPAITLPAVPEPAVSEEIETSTVSPPNVQVELLGPVGEAVTGFVLNHPVDESHLAHTPASPDEKWIEVDVTRQLVVAWEGNTPVMAFLSSTGLPNTPTVLGNFNIYWKLESTLMTGPGYYLPDVPYTMYFHGGYALHGAYWHDSFGEPMSHGCVNLENENARSLFEWADPVVPEGQTQVTSSYDNPGTLVVVHQ
jgi:lipoprotein-anchoring transpeptidase ErfK/SrfK